MKKMSVITLSILMAMLFTASLATTAFAADKFGFVDLAKVFDEYQKTKDFDKSLEGKGAAKQAERDKLVAEVKKLRDEAELLSAKAKDDKQAVIDEKIKSLQEFDRVTRDDLRRERDTMVREILKEIDTVLQDFGKKGGYTYVFNDRVLLYKLPENDLTAQVVTTLNGSYAPKKK